MNTPCKSPCTSDEELISYYPESDYWQTVHEQQSLYNYAANNQKKERFIKSPIIIYNHCYAKGALETAYLLRYQLEEEAKKSPVYIRPVLLIVVHSPLKNKVTSLQELKLQLITDGIPQDEIRIKTTILDELSGEDLLSASCSIRYIITDSEGKDNWRCPFAYIMVSLDKRYSSYNLIHVLNSLLPQPHSISYHSPLLNAGYILTASSRFEEIKTHIQSHLHALNMNTCQFIASDNLIELLRRVSVFEILKGDVNYGLEDMTFHPRMIDPAVTEDIKKLVFDKL